MSEPLDLEAIEARLDAAAHAHELHTMPDRGVRRWSLPWRIEEGDIDDHYIPIIDAWGIRIGGVEKLRGHQPEEMAFAVFIANAPADIDALIAEVERLRAAD